MRHFAQSPVVRMLLACVVFVLVGCRGSGTLPPFDPDDPAAAEAKLRRHLQRHPNDDEAWRALGHVQWLHLRKTDEAIATLDRLVKRGDVAATLSRLLIAEARLDATSVHPLAEALVRSAADGKGDAALREHAAEHAARSLGRFHGDLPGDDDRFVKFFAEIDRRKLPFAVKQPLISLRASIDRRSGAAYRKYYQQEGCVQAWQGSAVEGTLGARELQLRLDPLPPFEPDEAAIVPLSCVVRVWNPTAMSGIRRLRTFLDVRSGRVELDLSAEQAMVVFLDGRVLHRTDVTDGYPANRRRYSLELAPGLHELQIAVAVPTENTWVLVRAAEADGSPVTVVPDPGKRALATPFRGRGEPKMAAWPKPLGPLTGPLYEPLRLQLALESALADGDSDRAERHARALERFDAFGEGHFLRAQFERADPSRGQTVSAAREQAALEKALAVDPKMDAARLRLLEIQLGRGDDDDVIEALQALPQGRLAGVRGHLLRFRAYQTAGQEHRAERQLEAAAKLNPQHCSVLMSQRAIARDRGAVAKEDRLAKALERCPGTLELRAELAQTRHRFDEAEALYLQALDRMPDDVELLESLARLAATRGDDAKAEGLLRKVLDLNPQRVGVYVGLADLAAASGDERSARDRIRRALLRLPWSGALRTAAADLGISDDLQQFRVDGLDAVREYRQSKTAYEGVGEVLILDRSVARVYADGGLRTIVHMVVHLLNKEALDRYGEIDTSGRLLTLRSIKPDGRVLEPERIPGKDGLSLRDLEVGDIVDYEFVVEQGPPSAMPGYVDVTSFRFQSQDVPYHRSELVVVYPEAMKLKVDRRNEPPQAESSTIEVDGRTLAVRHWRAEKMPRLGVEPGHRALLDELPSVRVYTTLDVHRWLQNLAGNVRYAQRRNPALRQLVRQLIKGKPTERDQLEALWTWVVEKIEDGGDLSVPATATYAARSGNRLMLLRAMLEEAGIPSQLWLAADGFGAKPVAQGHPMVENYDAALLAVFPDGATEPVMTLTASKVIPIGYLTPGYSGTRGLRLQLEPDEPPPGEVVLPTSPAELADSRAYALDIQVDASGAGEVKGTITLQGMEAVAWRQVLRDVDRDRVEEVFQQAELGWLRGARLSSLEIDNEKDLRAPLKLRFEATAEGLGISQGGALVLRSAPLSFNPGAQFTALPARTTGIVVPYAPRQTAEITFRLKGARFVEVPEPATIDSPFGRFAREVKAGGTGKSTLTLRYDSTLRAGVVEAERYDELAAYTRNVEAAEQAVIKAK